MTDHLVARVTIERHLTDDDDVIAVSAEDDSGEVLPLIESLTLLRWAEHTLMVGDE